MRRYILMVIPAVLLWLFVTGCYTKLYRAGVNGPPEGGYSDAPYDRYVFPGYPWWYYGYPWWYSHHGGWGHGGGTITPGEPPSKRPVGRDPSMRPSPPPSVEAPSRPPPTHVTNPPKPAPSRPPSKGKKENKQRDSDRRKR